MKKSCSKCGANLNFNPSAQKVYCEYCNSEFDIEDIKINKEEDLSEYKQCVCKLCGTEVLSTEKREIIKCTFCGGKEFIDDSVNKEYILEGIIPFKISREQFIESCEEFLCSLFGTTGNEVLKKADIRGVYVPYSFINNIFKDLNNVEMDNFLKEILPYDSKNIKEVHPLYLDGYAAEVIKKTKEEEEFNVYVSCFYWVPVWIAEIENSNNKISIVMNGETWKMTGNFKSENDIIIPDENKYNLIHPNIENDDIKTFMKKELLRFSEVEIRVITVVFVLTLITTAILCERLSTFSGFIIVGILWFLILFGYLKYKNHKRNKKYKNNFLSKLNTKEVKFVVNPEQNSIKEKHKNNI